MWPREYAQLQDAPPAQSGRLHIPRRSAESLRQVLQTRRYIGRMPQTDIVRYQLFELHQGAVDRPWPLQQAVAVVFYDVQQSHLGLEFARQRGCVQASVRVFGLEIGCIKNPVKLNLSRYRSIVMTNRYELPDAVTLGYREYRA